MSAFDGTWRPDVQWFDADREPDEFLLTAGAYTCRSAVPAYTVPADGEPHPVAGQEGFDSLAVTVVDDRTVRRVARLRGALIVDAVTVVSVDGREKTEIQTQYPHSKTPVDFMVRSRRIGRHARGTHAISGRWRAVEADLPNHEEDTVYSITDGVFSMRDGFGRSFVAPLDGTIVPYDGSPRFDRVSVRWLAEDTIEEVDRLGRLAASLDVLAGAEGERPRPTEFDLGALVRSAADLAAPALARRSVALAVDVADGLVVRARPDELAQVMANLLQNAVRYAAAGGTVRVEAARTPDGVQVRVANTGSPIPPDDLPRVWERFYRVEKSRDPARGGAGIGLAIVKRLVEDAGGRVGAASDASWTTFWFRLPVVG